MPWVRDWLGGSHAVVNIETRQRRHVSGGLSGRDRFLALQGQEQQLPSSLGGLLKARQEARREQQRLATKRRFDRG